MRIVSVVPSQTELLFNLGLDEEVIGITKFCIHPNKWFLNKTKVGGTKNLSIDKIHSLNPSLILANKEENTKEQIELLQAKYPVYVSDVKSMNEAFAMIREIGRLVDKKNTAEDIVSSIQLSKQQNHYEKSFAKVLYLIWYKPYMAAGHDTFINSMLDEAGYENCIKDKRYPVISLNDIVQLNPDFIFLSSEPFPFRQSHIDELHQCLPQSKILLVDGELFSWYGSRICQSYEYFRGLNEKLF